METVFDRRGEPISIGDIVYRARFSELTIHKVLGFTRRSIILSDRLASNSYTYSGGYTREYTWRSPTKTIESLSEHNTKFYYPKSTDPNYSGLIKH